MFNPFSRYCKARRADVHSPSHVLPQKDTPQTVAKPWKKGGSSSAAIFTSVLLYGIINSILTIPTPMPVIGGYLAFIGNFCLYAGLALCTGLVVNNVESMISVFDNAHDVLLCVPGVLGGAFLLAVSQRYDNSFVLSAAIMVMPVLLFFIMLGRSVQ